MSTTPDPTPFDETPVDTSPIDTSPTDTTPVAEYTPVEPSLAGPEAEPLIGDVPTVDVAPEPEPRPSLSQTAAAMREADLKALYAFAGFTELAVGAVRSTVTDTQRWANARLAELRFRRQELAKQTEQVRLIAEKRVPEDIKAVPEVAKGRVTELQEQATSTYSDLATRGQRVLNSVRSDVTGRIDPTFDKIQERIDAARALIKSRAAAAAAATSAPAPQPAAPTVPDEVVPETLVADGVLIDDGSSEPLDEVISPTVPPTFDAPATDRQV
ncbi:hypothetical protein [uncultured Friedmanniella sp.]|uniref:hypothetical protein n=1 Tax=uncultured Friedmanniella sp. TaxID=335381 RepID=UPI0035C94807